MVLARRLADLYSAWRTDTKRLITNQGVQLSVWLLTFTPFNALHERTGASPSSVGRCLSGLADPPGGTLLPGRVSVDAGG